jgi:PAS domain S-box-containing protein
MFEATDKYRPAGTRARFWHMIPRGGTLPEDVWRLRHHFLLGLAWLHAIVIALIGPLLGYPLRPELSAFFHDGTTNHTIAEGGIVAVLALLALARLGRTFKATIVGLALMSASAILVHLSGGYIELHFHFFVMVVFLALYQDWAPYLIAIAYVAIHHGLVGVLAPADVYNHADAIAEPWKWAGIHAFFVLWAAVGSVIAWRFNEAAFARTKLILDVAGDGICGVDHDGKVTFANPAAQRMLGFQGEDILGRPLGEVLGHADAEGQPFGVGSPILQAMKQAATFVSSDEIFRRRDGTSFVADYVSNPIVEQGRFSGAVIAFTDVTNRKRAQEELKERYRQLTALHDIGQMIFASNHFNAVLDEILDRTLSLLSLDLGNLRLLGSDGSMQLSACRGYHDPGRVGKYASAVREGGRLDLMRRVASGKSVVLDDIASADGLRSLKGEGSRSAVVVPIITVTETLGIIEVASRAPRHFRVDEVRLLEAIGHQIGIAIQKARLVEEAERRARQQEALNAIAMATSQTLNFEETLQIALDKVLEVTGREKGYIRLRDPLTGMLGLAAHRGIGRYLESRAKDTRVGSKSERVFASGEALVINDASDPRISEEVRLEGGRAFVWVPLKVRGAIVGIMNVSTNRPAPFQPHEVELVQSIGNVVAVAIENARLFQQLSKNAQELERSNADLQHFAYIASHDLQEPLRMVSSYMQLLSRRYKGKLDADADEFIDFAVDGATRMQALINALLSYSRVDTQGKAFEPTDCEQILDATLASLKNAIEDSGAEISRGALPTVKADAMQLGQVFQNLIANAIKFRNHHAPVVRISAEQKGAAWVFTIADNGIGFEPQHAERVFVMFQRLHGKDEYAGTGIGLAVCKKIIERHGGQIWVDSKPGEGTSFHFTLPA